MLAKGATGFIYLVSSMGVTGVRDELGGDLQSIVRQIREVTSVPVYIGFGISTPEQVKEICRISDGAIVGSALVKLIAEHGGESADFIKKYVERLANHV
jgi:tryptophan synthase alpha chain